MKDEKATTMVRGEGARGFAPLLHEIDDGALHAELSSKLQQVVSELALYTETYCSKAKGKVTLTLSLEAGTNGTVQVHGEVKTKTPPPRRGATMFWTTKGGNLSLENPRQTKLPLREVPPPPAAPRDVAAGENIPPRSV